MAPLQARDGSTYVVADGRVVSVRAYVEAAAADRASPTVRAQAPRLLARVHRAAAAWPAVRPRPDGSIDRRIADEVVAAYVDAGGHDESYALEPLIRQFLLTTCLHSLTRAATGASWNAGFVAMIERALERLA